MKQLFIDNKCVEVTEDDAASFLAGKIRDIVPEVCVNNDYILKPHAWDDMVSDMMFTGLQ